MKVYEVGVFSKGDPCAVDFPDGQPSWLCRIAGSLAAHSDVPELKSMYECITPHGSVLVAGAVWVRQMTDEELDSLRKVEESAVQSGVLLYRGRIQL